jgi:hypothetical protein
MREACITNRKTAFTSSRSEALPRAQKLTCSAVRSGPEKIALLGSRYPGVVVEGSAVSYVRFARDRLAFDVQWQILHW